MNVVAAHAANCQPGALSAARAERNWGWAVQLYATRSSESWGMGDLADLRRIAVWAAGLRATMLLVNPLGAASPLLPQQPRPYYPIEPPVSQPVVFADRRGARSIVPRLGTRTTWPLRVGLSTITPRIDRDQVFKLKQAALERLFASFSGDPAFDQYGAEQGSQLREFATFCTLTEKLGGDWRSWPAEFRSPGASDVQRFADENAARVRYHQWLQWLLDDQLRRASADLPLMYDLPIGVDPGGADAWAWQDVLAQGVSVGAPPDVYNTQGQDWGLPPFVPHKLRAAGYEPFVQTIRAALRHAGALRIDHVMGLFRLFWIPWGFGPKRGAFVRYRPDEMLAILALESHRAGAYVVGEDLGTVEDGVREQLLAHSVLSYRLLWFEDEPPASYPRTAMVAATTHDLPTIAGLWSGTDLADQHRLGLKPSDEAVKEMRDRLAEMTRPGRRRTGRDRHRAGVQPVVGGAVADRQCHIGRRLGRASPDKYARHRRPMAQLVGCASGRNRSARAISARDGNCQSLRRATIASDLNPAARRYFRGRFCARGAQGRCSLPWVGTFSRQADVKWHCSGTENREAWERSFSNLGGNQNGIERSPPSEFDP